MKWFHSLSFSVFVKPEDDAELLTGAFKSIFPFSLEEQRVLLSDSVARGFDNRAIRILEVRLDKDRLIRDTVERLKELLGSDQCALLSSQENRLDAGLHFFFRLDKARLIAGEFVLTDGGDCVHARASVAAFPKRIDVARRLLKEIFK